MMRTLSGDGRGVDRTEVTCIPLVLIKLCFPAAATAAAAVAISLDCRFCADGVLMSVPLACKIAAACILAFPESSPFDHASVLSLSLRAFSA